MRGKYRIIKVDWKNGDTGYLLQKRCFLLPLWLTFKKETYSDPQRWVFDYNNGTVFDSHCIADDEMFKKRYERDRKKVDVRVMTTYDRNYNPLG